MLRIPSNAETSYPHVRVAICLYVLGKSQCRLDKGFNGNNQAIGPDLLCGFHCEDANIRPYIDEDLTGSKKMLQVAQLRLQRIPEQINPASPVPVPVVSFDDRTILQPSAQERGTGCQAYPNFS